METQNILNKSNKLNKLDKSNKLNKLDKQTNKLNTNLNILQTLMEKYPCKDWSWFSLSYNPNITLDFIEKNLYKVDWKRFSYNPNLTVEFIEKYPYENWD